MPLAGHPLEFGLTPVLELDPGAHHEILDRGGNEHLTCLGPPGHARSDVDGHPTDAAVATLALSAVKARTKLEAECLHVAEDLRGRLDRSCGAVERREDPVAGRVDDVALVALDLLANEAVVAIEDLSPGSVAEPGGMRSRIDDVREQDPGKHPVRRTYAPRPGDELLDLVDDPVGALGVQQVIRAGNLDKPSPGDALGNVASKLDGDRAVVGAVQDQGGGADHRQHMADVEILV